ncbi:MAG: Glu/Leu/Phe/Val family dehydrogenase [Bdellovibrionia bacterium]
MVFEKVQAHDFEQVVFCQDSRVGLKAIISLHSTVLGPATGGCRMWNYGSEGEALEDVLRLSRGMTYKSSLAGLDWGGGKAVIWGDAKTQKTPELLQRFGEFVERLGGHYITAKDVGIDSPDLKLIKSKTSHVLGIDGESNSSGDPSPATGLGVYYGMRATARHVFQTPSLKGMKIALQGLGSVSYYLLEHLVAEGAQVIGCDIDPAQVKRAAQKYGIEVVQPEKIFDVDCDIFSPCALGAVINAETLPRLKAKAIAGGANNQLATPEIGHQLMRKGIVYVPDYAINAGGVINIYYENPQFGPYSQKKAYEHVARIEKTIAEILDRSMQSKRPPHEVADQMAEERILLKKGLKKS